MQRGAKVRRNSSSPSHRRYRHRAQRLRRRLVAAHAGQSRQLCQWHLEPDRIAAGRLRAALLQFGRPAGRARHRRKAANTTSARRCGATGARSTTRSPTSGRRSILPPVGSTSAMRRAWSSPTAPTWSPTAHSESSYLGNMLVLPTGEILWTDISGNAYVYTSSGSPNPAWAPRILPGMSPTNISRGKTYHLFGNNLNGFSQGAAYGDDAQAATNYPLVRLTNRATGHVFYARTHDHSTMAVAYSGTASTQYDVPAAMETGPADLVVVANGIPSAAMAVIVN